MKLQSGTGDSVTPRIRWRNCDMADIDVVALVLAGNDAAYEVIMRRYNRMLFRLARGIVRNDEDARDVVQESYVRAYRRLAQFRGPKGFPSWLARIVINEATSRMRKAVLPRDHEVETDQLPVDVRERPEHIAMRKDTLQLIEAAVDELPAEFRLVFILRGVEQLSVKETAEVLDINPATVKTRFHRARVIMKKSLARKLNDTVPSSFSFGGEHCDRIVATVFERIAGISNHQH